MELLEGFSPDPDFSEEPDFSLDAGFSLDPEPDAESLFEDPLVELLADSRLSVR